MLYSCDGSTKKDFSEEPSRCCPADLGSFSSRVVATKLVIFDETSGRVPAVFLGTNPRFFFIYFTFKVSTYLCFLQV